MGSGGRKSPLALAALVAATLTLGVSARAGEPLPFRHRLARASARLTTLASRAVFMPASVWPMTKIVARLAHGEPMAGLTPGHAAAVATEITRARGTGVVVGRLAWELRDLQSIRGAERSYRRLVHELGRANAPGAAISLDPESLGLQLRAASDAERRRIAGAAVLRLARAAHEHGLAVELDMGTSDAMPNTLAVAHRLVEETGIPVRLALAARYRASERALLDWAALARRQGMRLGVRLVKGSFLEADNPDAIHERGPLLAQYRRLISLALAEGEALDVVAATHNADVWGHAKAEAQRLGTPVRMNAVRGIRPELQEAARREGLFGREYISYGLDAPGLLVSELLHNWRQRRLLRARGIEDLD